MTRNDESMGCRHETTVDARTYTQLAGILRSEMTELEEVRTNNLQMLRAVVRATVALELAEAELRNLALAIVEASGEEDEEDMPDEEPDGEDALEDDARFDAPAFLEAVMDKAPPEPKVAPQPAKKKRGRPKKSGK